MSIKVAYVCPRYYPYVGGVENHVKAIGERVTRKGIGVDILTTDASGKLAINK